MVLVVLLWSLNENYLTKIQILLTPFYTLKVERIKI